MTGRDALTQHILLKAPIGYVAIGDRCIPLAAMTHSGAIRMVAANLLRAGAMSGVSAPALLSDVASGRASVALEGHDAFTQAIHPYIQDMSQNGTVIGYGLPRMMPVYGTSLDGEIYFGLVENDLGTHTMAGASKQAVVEWTHQVARELLDRPDLDGPTAERIFSSEADCYINVARVEPSPDLKTTLAVASLSAPEAGNTASRGQVMQPAM